MEKKTKQRTPLAEMNLIDDFLFTEVMTDEENGLKACRIILETVLKRKVGKISYEYQKVVPGISEETHGIRLDTFVKEKATDTSDDGPELKVYDIEADKTEQKKDGLAKRSRYYSDLVDVQLLETGTDYDALPELITIFILSYDPFGKDDMYYEAKTILTTHPDMLYNDGIRRIFLYAGGKLPEDATEDDEKIKTLLQYIVNSTNSNVTDDATDELDRIVKETKARKDVGIRYMKSWEREREIREEGKAEGREEGREEGIQEGRKEERANTEAERKRADEAENRADKAENRANSAEAELTRYKEKFGSI